METTNYKRTIAGSVGAGIASVFNASGRKYYILEHKTATLYHPMGESQKIIIDQIELGRDGACQVRFDETCETVSRRHAAIVRDGENWKIIPLSQTNATIVNGAPIYQDTILKSGDEIKLSSRGPVMGFIIPQGAQSMVKSIGLTERMNLFRKQALRPYKVAIWIMAIVLILAVGGLTTYNILQDKAHAEQMAAANAKIESAQEAVNELSIKADKADAELLAANAEAERLRNKVDATEAEIAAANARAQAAQSAAYSARRAANDAAKELQTAKEEYEAATIEKKAETKSAKSAEQAFAEQMLDEETSSAPKETKVTEFAEIEQCFDAVYYVRMDNVCVYNTDNTEAVRFNTEHLIGGTGFLLEDGRFITACRVVEPWFYYKNTVLGKRKGHEWTFRDIQVCANAGLKVVANYTAYSPSGSSFKFTNTEMTNKASVQTKVNYYSTEYVRLELGQIRTLVKRAEVELYWHNNHPTTDWASMAKREQLNVVKGLKYDNAFSLSPKAGPEVSILGYPKDEGFTDSHKVNPQDLRNNINVSRLNDEGVIELSSRRWKVGNDGAPVLVNQDGQWTVIGVLSHTDSADRDLVIPIASTK